MPTLGSLPADKPELRLTFVWGNPKRARATEITGVVTMAPEQLLEDGVPGNLPDGSLVLITGAVPFRLRGRITTVLETLLLHMRRKGSPGLIVSAVSDARQPFPQSVVDQAKRLDVALLTTTAPAEKWEGVHEEIQQFRLRLAERRAFHLSSLVQELPAQLADSRAMQRIADWLARVLDVQVLVSEPERVLAASCGHRGRTARTGHHPAVRRRWSARCSFQAAYPAHSAGSDLCGGYRTCCGTPNSVQ